MDSFLQRSWVSYFACRDDYRTCFEQFPLKKKTTYRSWKMHTFCGYDLATFCCVVIKSKKFRHEKKLISMFISLPFLMNISPLLHNSTLATLSLAYSSSFPLGRPPFGYWNWGRNEMDSISFSAHFDIYFAYDMMIKMSYFIPVSIPNVWGGNIFPSWD